MPQQVNTTIQHAHRLKLRLRLAYYKVRTNQIDLPLHSLPLPVPSSPQQGLVGPEDPCDVHKCTPFKYDHAIIAAVAAAADTKLADPIPAMTPPVLTWSSGGYSSLGRYLATSGATVSASTAMVTPVKQQHYPFHLGTTTASENIVGSANSGTSINNNINGTDWEAGGILNLDDYGDITTTPAAMVAKSKAASSLLQLNHFQEL